MDSLVQASGLVLPVQYHLLVVSLVHYHIVKWCLQSSTNRMHNSKICFLLLFLLPSTPPSLLLYPPSSTTSPVPLLGVTLYLLLISMISTLHYYITTLLITFELNEI